LPGRDRYWIAPGAHVIGDVRLGAEVGIWFNAVLRGDAEPIAIGAGTNIQESALLHTDPGFPLTVGNNCTIGHHAILHGCRVGEGSLIGMGAIVLNGANIGMQSLVAAGSVVKERAEFPPRSLIVGTPARLVRELLPDAIREIEEAAQDYVREWRRFANELRPIG
jgi:carbonic anhydrase/acetyltransferase-like protein (isoleucine patch superfamily)